jgi:hypothetical protein
VSPIEYLSRMPGTIPTDKILVHNRGQPTSRLGSRAFRAWFDEPGDRYEICTCGWAPNLPEHYQIRQRGSAVPVNRTKGQIEAMLTDYGASHFAYFGNPKGEMVIFEVEGRRLRFNVPLEEGASPKAVRSRNQRWREFLQCVRAKLESVTTGIESFTEAFLAHVVMPDNRTVYEHVAPRIARIVEGGEMQPSLPEPASSGRGNPDC